MFFKNFLDIILDSYCSLYHEKGCFSFNYFWGPTNKVTNLNAETCASLCFSAGTSNFVLHGTTLCNCFTFAGGSSVPDVGCISPCPGDHTQKCGGGIVFAHAGNVYEFESSRLFTFRCYCCGSFQRQFFRYALSRNQCMRKRDNRYIICNHWLWNEHTFKMCRILC